MDEATKREIGIWLLIVLAALGTVLLEHVSRLAWSPMWIWFVGITWYASEGLGGFLIYHFFKVSKADIQKKEIILTEVKSVPKGNKTDLGIPTDGSIVPDANT
ncbi:hypothetical protein LCGC14_2609290 [marine sediment metagenome]|uniref:Uncharacterized protein n=1 Tax=marine sediment metagenome TaxID=412755 RepID=A0A0F9ATY8_9ZZZZ